MGNYHKIEEMLEDELAKISSQGKLTTSNLDVGDKVAHFLKSIKTIEAMDDAGYSEDYGYGANYGGNAYMDNSYGNSYARGRGSRAKRDSMGRYASRGNYARDGYSGNKQSLMMEIEELKDKLEGMED